jgi:RimJ/RimL family protein N-acetyltransferase
MVKLRVPLTREECQQIRLWRNDVAPVMRTGSKTEAEQDAFYHDVICNPSAPHRYFAIEAGNAFVGMGGLTHLDERPGEAEISLLIGPAFRGQHIGTAAVDALLKEAFETLGLSAVRGECYANGNLRFWTEQILERPATVRWTWDRVTLAKQSAWDEYWREPRDGPPPPVTRG